MRTLLFSVGHLIPQWMLFEISRCSLP